MKKTEIKLILCILLLCLNVAFIWGNSLLPAEVSQAFSDWVMRFLEAAPEEGPVSDTHVLRKAAHFLEFTSLGFLLAWLMVLLQKRKCLALPLGIAAACVDETIQMFVPERGPGILDVGIDSCGVLAGILLLQIGNLLLSNNQLKRYGGKQ